MATPDASESLVKGMPRKNLCRIVSHPLRNCVFSNRQNQSSTFKLESQSENTIDSLSIPLEMGGMELIAMTVHDFPLERYRPLLNLHLRQLQLGRFYQARFDSSGIVQESLLREVKALDQVRGQNEAERVRLLQAIVKNVQVEFVREQRAAKRDSRME